MNELPPLGLAPKWVWQGKRITEIIEAMNRYITADLEIPIRWVEEYNELVAEIKTEEGE
ncbi:MAG: hypothetical protein PHG75_05205 [Syntrophomonas sp.]|nr:hypothetical protein [Syntrophomonas sp.]